MTYKDFYGAKIGRGNISGLLAGRLPQELRLRGITTLEAANDFLQQCYMGEFNRRFARPAAQNGTAFVPLKR